jgi:hypothetical protein
MGMLSIWRRALLLPLVLVAASCGIGLGTVGTLGTLTELVRSARAPGQAAQPVQITAEVQRVEPRRQLIHVQTADGRAGGVIFDLGTVVLHEDQPYPITSLEPGDVVNLQLQEVAQNNLYANRIEVVQLASEDPAPASVPGEAAAPVTAPVPEEPAPPAETPLPGGPPAPAERAVPAEPAPRAERIAPAAPQTYEGEVGEIDLERGMFELQTEERGTITVSLPFNPPAAALERFENLQSGETLRVEAHPLTGTRVELRRFSRED